MDAVEDMSTASFLLSGSLLDEGGGEERLDMDEGDRAGCSRGASTSRVG